MNPRCIENYQGNSNAVEDSALCGYNEEGAHCGPNGTTDAISANFTTLDSHWTLFIPPTAATLEVAALLIHV
jgi:hypothetical protein